MRGAFKIGAKGDGDSVLVVHQKGAAYSAKGVWVRYCFVEIFQGFAAEKLPHVRTAFARCRRASIAPQKAAAERRQLALIFSGEAATGDRDQERRA
jgi:hypothetical protein